MYEELLKSLINLLCYLIVGYLGLLLIVFLFQRSLLYFPEKQKPAESQLHYQGMSFWPSEQHYRGITSLSPPLDARGSVVVFHGNAGAAHHRSYYLEALAKHNLNVILAEYPGYGGRNGELSEASFLEDGLKTLELVHQQYGSPIYLWGESLGAGVASSIMAKTQVPIKGLVLFTPWDSLSEVAQSHYWYLPAKWLVKDQYNSVQNLKAFSGNVAVVLAEHDQVIPMKHGEKLFDGLTTNKRIWLMEDAGHNTIPLEPHQKWWGEVVEFVRFPLSRE